MPLSGTYEHSIDEKNRLSIPAALRNQLDPEHDGKRFYVVPGTEPGSLWLYPERRFHRLAEQFDEEVSEDEEEAYERALFGIAELLEMDAGGRVVLPAGHIQRSGMGREVTLQGVRDHVEVVNRSDFARRADDQWRNFAEIRRRARATQRKRQSGQKPDHP